MLELFITVHMHDNVCNGMNHLNRLNPAKLQISNAHTVESIRHLPFLSLLQSHLVSIGAISKLTKEMCVWGGEGILYTVRWQLCKIKLEH